MIQLETLIELKPLNSICSMLLCDIQQTILHRAIRANSISIRIPTPHLRHSHGRADASDSGESCPRRGVRAAAQRGLPSAPTPDRSRGKIRNSVGKAWLGGWCLGFQEPQAPKGCAGMKKRSMIQRFAAGLSVATWPHICRRHVLKPCTNCQFPDMPCMKRAYMVKKAPAHHSVARNEERPSSP